ncbi:hypothetical protein [Pseudomonas sp.]|uniref:hypothetical protein n=1 Tax=Pseudomonas sp. TaxID=306 RepID=UPI00299F3A61|nr:hypothetical protein [Pseudomonas sp.]MDX1366881.1 hypothetical protein [Pseudomonas sp.]
MRATFARLLIPSLALALAGCGGSNNPYPRVEFPKSAGNYIQFYRDGGVTVEELAKVDSGGTVQSITSARWYGKVHLDVGVNNQTALFDGCGVLITFKERANDKIGTSAMTSSEVAKAACPLNPLPAEWNRVGPAKARS